MHEVTLDPAAWNGLDDDAQALLAEWEVGVGEAVEAGQTLGTAELVKASMAIVAPAAGQVAALSVAAGDSFSRRTVLALLR